MSIEEKKLAIVGKLAWVIIWLLGKEDRYFSVHYTLTDVTTLLNELIEEKKNAESIRRKERDIKELPTEVAE